MNLKEMENKDVGQDAQNLQEQNKTDASIHKCNYKLQFK